MGTDITITVQFTFEELTRLADLASTSPQVSDALFEKLVSSFVYAYECVEAAAADMLEEPADD